MYNINLPVRTQQEIDAQIKLIESKRLNFSKPEIKSTSAILSILRGEKTFTDYKNEDHWVKLCAQKAESWLCTI